MRLIVRSLAAFGLLLATRQDALAACDPSVLANARAQIATECDCASASNHGEYVSCVTHATNDAVKAGTLSSDCVDAIMNCASNSTCGKPGFVTCCRTDAGGITSCSVVNKASNCTAPQGGTAQVGTQSSCCDACAGGGTTTTTTTTTGGACSACTGGVPGHISFTTTVGSGECGHLDADGTPNFFPLACGGLYFGGANVGVPLPSKVPDQGSSITNAACASGTTLTVSGASAAETAGGTPPNNR